MAEKKERVRKVAGPAGGAVLKFEAPGKDDQGFLERTQRALEFKDRLISGNVGAAIVDELIEFLLPYVVEPADREEARETLLHGASQTQFLDMMAAMTGGGQEGEVPFGKK